MVDVLFLLLFADVDTFLGLFTAGEAVTVTGLAFALILCNEGKVVMCMMSCHLSCFFSLPPVVEDIAETGRGRCHAASIESQ